MASDYNSREHTEDVYIEKDSVVETRSEEINNLEDETQNMDEEIPIIGKRVRDTDSTEVWTQYHRNAKKKTTRGSDPTMKPPQSSYQISVTCKDKLPKQFALAKLLKTHDISVSRVKYVNPFRILFSFDDETSAEKFLQCDAFKELGWDRRKTWEVGVSYGIIKNIDLERSEKELLESIYSPTVEIVSVKRLSRRGDQGWTPSETVRIGFYGPQIPTHVYLFELSIKVDSYVFPVTQCSRCWRFGHMVKMCPSTKIICPKCGSLHANCDTTLLKCVNCSGQHISLDKTCPVYTKEKRIRELMTEYNCSYQKALTIYVPPSPIPLQYVITNQVDQSVYGTHSQDREIKYKEHGHIYTGVYRPASYAEMTAGTSGLETPQKPKRIKIKREKRSLKENTHTGTKVLEGTSEDEDRSSSSNDDLGAMEDEDKNINSKPEIERSSIDQVPTIQELLGRLKNIIFRKRISISDKIKSILKTILDWTIIFLVKHVSDLSIVKKFLALLTANG